MHRIGGIQLSTKWILIGVFAFMFILAGFGGFFFWKYTSLKGSASDSATTQSEQVLERVNKLYKLPTGESPSVAEVKDKSKLGSQAFFKDAQNGDYVLIYKEAKIALLYRGSENRLINVAPVSLDTGQTAGASTQNK